MLPLMQFSIDVGGAFTDCMARSDDRKTLRHKVLSTGVTKGAVGRASDRTQISDPVRIGDPPCFWKGYSLRLVDGETGLPVWTDMTLTEGPSGHRGR